MIWQAKRLTSLSSGRCLMIFESAEFSGRAVIECTTGKLYLPAAKGADQRLGSKPCKLKLKVETRPGTFCQVLAIRLVVVVVSRLQIQVVI
jgi:hypothetical protein